MHLLKNKVDGIDWYHRQVIFGVIKNLIFRSDLSIQSKQALNCVYDK
jgi:hypothetical protein